jgi:hypothetical protein
VVREGGDSKRDRDRDTKKSTHKLIPVYREMLLQICRDYTGLPDPRTLTLVEIAFFYEALREELHRRTKLKK